jgi:hypothetical protein
MCIILAFSGKIGSGKNYIAETIVFPYLRAKNKNVVILSFADYLKLQCNLKDRILYDRLFVEKDIESRKILQERGTTERKENGKIFIEAMDCMIKMFSQRGVDVILIPDLRFNNEFEFIKNKGGILVRVNSPNRNRDKLLKECEGDKTKADMISSHISERELDNRLDFHYIINNDYVYSLGVENEIKNILNKYF